MSALEAIVQAPGDALPVILYLSEDSTNSVRGQLRQRWWYANIGPC